MKEEKQELRYRLAGGTSIEWSVATTFDEFIQNGVYEIKVINDAGTLNLPFRFTGDDVARLVVSDNPQQGKLQQGRSIAQEGIRHTEIFPDAPRAHGGQGCSGRSSHQ